MLSKKGFLTPKTRRKGLCRYFGTKIIVACDDIHCTLTGWSEWINSSCSVTCGSGTRTRTRRCLYGRCVGRNNENVPCYLRRCPSMIQPINIFK